MFRLEELAPRRAGLRTWTAAVLAVSLAFGSGAWAKEPPAELAAVRQVVALSELPKEAQETHARILTGGPFKYDKDGTVFGNRERLLPRQPRGYYREYTVKTPRSRDRGARRIVCGGEPPTRPDACYYTDDHYASFRRIAP